MHVQEVVVFWPKAEGVPPRLLARFTYPEGLDQVLVTYGEGPSCQRWSRARADQVLGLMRQHGYQVADVSDAELPVARQNQVDALALELTSAEPLTTATAPLA